MARPTKLTPEVQATFLAAMENGCTFETAAEALELDVATVRRWLARGEIERSGRFVEFRAAVLKAKASVVQRLLAAAHERIKPKSEGGVGADPLALLAVLDRRYAPRVRDQVHAELSEVLDRLEREFAREPALLERVMSAIAGEAWGVTNADP